MDRGARPTRASRRPLLAGFWYAVADAVQVEDPDRIVGARDVAGGEGGASLRPGSANPAVAGGGRCRQRAAQREGRGVLPVPGGAQAIKRTE